MINTRKCLEILERGDIQRGLKKLILMTASNELKRRSYVCMGGGGRRDTGLAEESVA